jgi:hypothetical protein
MAELFGGDKKKNFFINSNFVSKFLTSLYKFVLIHKLSKTAQWRKDQKTFLYHGINYFYGHFYGGWGIRSILSPV